MTSTWRTTASGHSGLRQVNSGVAAVSPANTTRNQSGDRASFTSVRTVPKSAPEASRQTVATVQSVSTAANGLSRRTIRARSHCPYVVPRARADA